MPYCPQCRSEYRDGFDTCAACNTMLVPELRPETLVGVEAIEQAVADGTAVVVAQGGFHEARRMRDVLGAGRVAAVVVGDPGSCDAHGTCSRYEVMVAPEGIEAARGALAAEFQQALLTEGLGHGGGDDAIDLDAGAGDCPACGTAFDPKAGPECVECGLYLGVPEA